MYLVKIQNLYEPHEKVHSINNISTFDIHKNCIPIKNVCGLWVAIVCRNKILPTISKLFAKINILLNRWEIIRKFLTWEQNKNIIRAKNNETELQLGNTSSYVKCVSEHGHSAILDKVEWHLTRLNMVKTDLIYNNFLTISGIQIVIMFDFCSLGQKVVISEKNFQWVICFVIC